MKTITKAISILSVLLALDAIAEPLTSFRLETKIQGKAEYTRGKSESKNQARTIEAEVTNTSAKESTSTVFKWTIYGHKMEDHKTLIVIEEGEEKITVPANGSIAVSSPEIKVAGNREYSVSSRSRSKSGGKSRTKVQKVPAAGEDYYGYAVEVFSEGKLVASYYSKPSIEKDMHPDAE